MLFQFSDSDSDSDTDCVLSMIPMLSFMALSLQFLVLVNAYLNYLDTIDDDELDDSKFCMKENKLSSECYF